MEYHRRDLYIEELDRWKARFNYEVVEQTNKIVKELKNFLPENLFDNNIDFSNYYLRYWNRMEDFFNFRYWKTHWVKSHWDSVYEKLEKNMELMDDKGALEFSIHREHWEKEMILTADRKIYKILYGFLFDFNKATKDMYNKLPTRANNLNFFDRRR